MTTSLSVLSMQYSPQIAVAASQSAALDQQAKQFVEGFMKLQLSGPFDSFVRFGKPLEPYEIELHVHHRRVRAAYAHYWRRGDANSVPQLRARWDFFWMSTWGEPPIAQQLLTVDMDYLGNLDIANRDEPAASIGSASKTGSGEEFDASRAVLLRLALAVHAAMEKAEAQRQGTGGNGTT